MNYVTQIIEVFGGQRAMSRATGFAQQKISAWAATGQIQDKHKPSILEAARLQNLPLTEASFFPVTPTELSTADR